MKTLIYLFLILILISNAIYAQITFEKTYGTSNNDFANYVEQTLDGGYILIGNSSFWLNIEENDSIIARNIILIKTDIFGNAEWTKTYDYLGNDQGYCVHETNDGGYIIAGYTTDFELEYSDVYFIKTDYLGDTTWTKTYDIKNHDKALSALQTNDGGYIIAGYCYNNISDANILLLKTNIFGDTIWTKEIGGNKYDNATSIQQTSDGGYIITGYTNSFGNGGYDIYLIKTDNMGDTIFTRTYGGYNTDVGYSIQQTDDGGYIIAGITWSFAPIDQRGKDAYLIKTDDLGDTIWTKRIGWESFESCKSIDQTNDGGYIITGYTESFGNALGDLYLIKTNIVGDTLWSKIFSGNGGNFGTSVQQTKDGGYIVAGYTSSYGEGQYDFYLIKTDQYGIVNVEENEFHSNYKTTIYPNPTDYNLMIQSFRKIEALKILNLNGKVVFDQDNLNQEFIELDISNLKTGMYLLKITTDKDIIQKKFIKLK